MIDLSTLNVAELPSMPLSAKASFPTEPAIYFAIDSTGNIQYIGRSVHPQIRWVSHHKFLELSALSNVRIAHLFLDEDLLPEVEKALIEWYRPPLNNSGMGKSRNPDYKQLGLYVKKDIHRRAKAKAAADDLELSQVVEDLLREWLKD